MATFEIDLLKIQAEALWERCLTGPPNRKPGPNVLSFALSMAPFVATRSSPKEMVHGLIAAKELRMSLNRMAATMRPVSAQPAN
jgi:hypothetical protein